jgi:hypothetical protein
MVMVMVKVMSFRVDGTEQKQIMIFSNCDLPKGVDYINAKRMDS